MEKEIKEKEEKAEKKHNVEPPSEGAGPPKPPGSLPKRKPLRIVIEEIYDYLHEYGASSPWRISRNLNLDPSEVTKALIELEKEGRVQIQSLDFIIKHRMETSQKQVKKKQRDRKEPFDLAYGLKSE